MPISINKKFKSLSYIFIRNIAPLTNWVLATVVVFLFLFGDAQAGLFLGTILAINILLGLAQDIHAWITLENLELLTAPHILRIKDDGSEESILTEDILKGDIIALKTGDQVPCDGILIKATTLEINEGLITGESASIPKTIDAHLLAGSIITAGTGTLRIETVFHESRIARMTEGLKTYEVHQSPIQDAVGKSVRFSGYILIVMILFVLGRGLVTQTSNLTIIKNIGALASIIVPQGLVFAITLLFAYGAAHFYRKNVLLQEVNATEKLGRIKNLCMDKTGTLSENNLVMENILIPKTIPEEVALNLIAGYIVGLGDATETISAIHKYSTQSFSGDILKALPFSSWRQYGAVRLRGNDAAETTVIAGGSEHLLPFLSQQEDKEWLQNNITTQTTQGKRILCFAQSSGLDKTIPTDLSQTKLSLVAVCVLHHKLRAGIREAINFFKRRGVRIRIISGDSPETVAAIAKAAGVQHHERVVSGSELEQWSSDEFADKVKDYTIFARIIPEQKERIIEALKQDGFTAMVGDGANDALAIKKADLGIAMFDGAPATRQLASIILTNNSFTALPEGVKLADSIIKNAEIFASIFFDMSFVGFFLFIMISASGYSLPITPLNITFINYFTVGFPGLLVSYWTIRPSKKIVSSSTQSLLRTILPFTIASSFLQAIALYIVFLSGSEILKTTSSNFMIVLAAIITGFIFFLFIPKLYRGTLLKSQIVALWSIAIFEVILLILMLRISFLLHFFDIHFDDLSSLDFVSLCIVMLVYAPIQYLLYRFFLTRSNATPIRNQ